MIFRTHIALAFLLILLFLPHVSGKIAFSIAVLIATIIPDIDSMFSEAGKLKIFRFLQFFVKHRGMIHSLTFAVVVSVMISIFLPAAGLGFFLGYGVHLFFDSFTKEGIQAFWPAKTRSSGLLRTGSRFETVLFIFLVLIDVLLLVLYFV